MVKQKDVDDIAAFVGVVEELRAGALFDEDCNRISVSYADLAPGNPFLLKQQLMADKDIKSALVPFRRIFADGEPSHYQHVRKILYSHMSDPWSRSELDHTSSIYKSAEKGWVGPWQSPLLPTDTLSIWINCEYFHSGKAQGKGHGRYSRDDFLRYKKQIGPELFEFPFQSKVYEFAVCYINLLPLAKQALASWQKQLGLVPACTQVPPSGIAVKRGPDRREIGSQKVERLLGRHSLDNLAETFQAMELGWDEIASVCEHETFAQGVTALSWTVCETDAASFPRDVRHNVRIFFDQATRTKGLISAYPDRRRLLVDGDGLHILDAYLQTLRVLCADETA